MATKAKTPNIDSMSLAELEALNKATQQRIADVREDERLKLRAEFEQRATENGFSLAEVVGVKKLRKTPKKRAPAKYANPEDPSQTWSGQGRPPTWMRELEESGRTRDELLIS